MALCVHRLAPALSLTGLLACTSARPPEGADLRAEGSDPIATDDAWARVTIQATDLESTWVRADYDFKGRITLPRSRFSEPMTVGPALVIATDGLYFDGALVAVIEGGAIVERALDGYRIPGLFDPLRRAIEAATATDRARGAEPSGVVTLFADQRVTFASLLPILYTSGQAGGREYDFAIQPTGQAPGGASDVLRIYPPRFLAEGEVPTETRVELMMMVSQTDVRIGRHDPQAPKRSAWIERINLGADRRPAMDRITEIARGLAAEEVWDAEVPMLRVGSERDVTLDLLFAAIAAAAGPECVFAEVRSQGRRCYFYAPVIHGGSPAPPELVDP